MTSLEWKRPTWPVMDSTTLKELSAMLLIHFPPAEVTLMSLACMYAWVQLCHIIIAQCIILGCELCYTSLLMFLQVLMCVTM